MNRKLNRIFVLFFLFVPTFAFAHSAVKTKPHKKPKWYENVWFDKRTKSLHVGETQIKVGAVMECGYFNNQAMYASFGFETQIFRCVKLVFPITLTHHKIFAKFEFAPIYNSIRRNNQGSSATYAIDSRGNPINGRLYVDWYKNLGTQIYYLGDVPVIDAYVGYHITAHNELIAGRFKNEDGLEDQDTPWSDDGMFSPYSYWLTRDLLAGLMYQATYKYAAMRAAILSGNNPMKGYANYLGQIQSPDLKANNTPSWSLNFDFDFGHFFSPTNKSKFTIGGMHNVMSSTWVSTNFGDGKRRNSNAALGLLINLPVDQELDFDLFGQYSWYMSGLMTNSSQNDGNARFKNITQSGYFAGATVHYRWFDLSYTYECFDRFDANVWANFILPAPNSLSGFTLAQLEAMKQTSQIINFTYHYNSHIAMVLGYQRIKNPLPWLSQILNTHPTYRVKATLLFTF